jgi:predicted ATP-dependent Lon-type protease
MGQKAVTDTIDQVQVTSTQNLDHYSANTNELGIEDAKVKESGIIMCLIIIKNRKYGKSPKFAKRS